MDAYSACTGSTPNIVELLETDGQWFVRIVENADESLSPGFERESFAGSYAEGQCVRLGLQSFRRS